jgi:hypothetical protein
VTQKNTLFTNFPQPTATDRVKCMGIEDLWGNVWSWVEGLITDGSRNILTAFRSFNDSGSGYQNRGQWATTDIAGSVITSQGTSERGFLARTAGGSSTTYYGDSVVVVASRAVFFGSNWSEGASAGIFHMYVSQSASFSATDIGSRLMYL